MARKRPSRSDRVQSDPPEPRSIAVDLEVSRITFPRAGLTPLPCPRCKALLGIHQPDTGEPGRLLATCENCGAWCVLVLDQRASKAQLVILPLEAIS